MIGRKGRLLAGLVTGVVATVVWFGSERQSSGPAAGVAFHSPTAVASHVDNTPRRLRVATFNVHSGKGSDGRRDWTRTTAALRDFDFVGLNEVRGATLLRADDDVALLARELEMPWLFAPAEHRWWHDHFGNGVLTTLPVRDWQRLPLPQRSKTFRNAVLTEVTVGGRSVRLLATHIDADDGSPPNESLRTVAEMFLALAEPAVLLGDMNADRDDTTLTSLLAEPGVVDAVGVALGSADVRRIDWILCRGLKPVAAGVVDSAASDHPLVWAELEVLE